MTAPEADSGLFGETATLIRQIGSAAASKPGQDEAIALQPPDSHERIIGLPAHDEMDELTLMMLNQLVVPSGFPS